MSRHIAEAVAPREGAMTERSESGMSRVAIVGMACRYPDAAAPSELWENVVAGRRAFRRLPDERMRLEDYWSPDPAAPDRIYARTAAVLEGYEFDRIGYKIAGSTYRSTDLTHWLALDMAARALADAGYPMAEGLPRERTTVVIGNTLTGEFTRANVMRLRWPYVRRTLAGALGELGWEDERTASFLADVERRYKSPFPPIDEDSLAGGLSNTIAGRICNYFDLKGGGYTVDGACSSSLLSVVTACKALRDGEADVAVAGGVDLSIDPFETVGFAKTGALARNEMRVYDRGSNGFWPGEGCGMVVLMREDDAARLGHRVYATVAGAGISSDGKGGITRPEVSGYRLALRRAYEQAGFGIDTVTLFEGHGTGTEVGDATELTALSQARAAAGADVPAAIGTIKGAIGHTKAAAGVAGLIKAALALHHQVLPPTTGCFDPHPLLDEEPVTLRVLRKAEPWPAEAPLRAGVTAMGFGGINTHIVLEGAEPRREAGGPSFRALAGSVQDAELLLVDAASPEELRERLAELAGWVPAVSYAQLADLAAALQARLGGLPCRAAAVVSSPLDAERRLRRLLDALDTGETTSRGSDGKTFLGHAERPGRIGYLFPGQGSGRGTSGGALRRRLAEAEEIYTAAALPSTGDMVITEVAQPRIVTGSMAGLRALGGLGLEAAVAVGHSLGEISALHWAGVLDERTLLRVAGVRGQTMAGHSASGTMAGLGTTPEAVSDLIAGLPVVIAACNGPEQTVIAGTVDAVQEAGHRAERAGVSWTRLQVSHAFHSPLVAPAADAFVARLAGEDLGPVRRRVVSTVTGEALEAGTDVRELLRRQITEPVLFSQAVNLAAKEVDLFVEVGPGRVLTGLARGITDVPAVALDTDGESLSGLLSVAGAAFAAGAPVRTEALFEGRLVRPLEVGTQFRFLASPCEQAPRITIAATAEPVAETAGTGTGADAGTGAGNGAAPVSSVELLRGLAAERAELPLTMVREDSRLLDELHLSSITVGQLLTQAARRLNLSVVQPPINFATATIREMAETLDTLVDSGGGADAAPVVDGAAAWARSFAVTLEEVPVPAPAEAADDGPWQLFGERTEPAVRLRDALERAHVGAGVLVWLPPGCGRRDLAAALEAAKTAASGRPGGRFVLVQHGRGAAGLAKTLRQEAGGLRVTIAQVPAVPEAVDWIVVEVAATTGFAEARYDARGVRRVPTLRALPMGPARRSRALGPGDVLLVTGGGKGITAECALAVAADTGAALAVLGRSDPGSDPELAENLRRMAARDVTVRYVRADVTDAAQVRRAVEEVTGELGRVTGVLHGAGRNEPAALSGLDMAAFQGALAPKVDGLHTVLDAVEPGALRLLVTFGSIIGRAGLRGEAHYATANEWLAAATEEFAERHPRCRSLCLEWSVWSGVGMGERLSVVEELAAQGITAIHPDQGVEIMRRLVADPDAPAVVVVSGRTGDIDTIRREAPELPLLRFVARPLVRYHGVELVTEAELNTGTDPYLSDHLLDGNLLFPAVMGMEAMTQVAAAATGRRALPVIEDAEFLRPIVVPPESATVVRVAATVTADDTVAVSIRSAETDFAAEHFRARLRFTGDAVSSGAPDGPPHQAGDDLPAVPLDPRAELYGGLLFQGGRFHRLRRYHRLAAREVDADLALSPETGWFAGFLPGGLLLGDPGMRDALMHGNQVCVPHATLLPIGIDRLYPCGDLAGEEEVRYCAVERQRDGDTYVYDVVVRTRDGRVVERWEGLRLRAVRKSDGRGPWVVPLLGPYLERTLEDLTGAPVAVAVEPLGGPGGPGGAGARPDPAVPAVARALGPGGEMDGRRTRVAHGAGLTLAVAAAGPLACAVEPVAGEGPDEVDEMDEENTAAARLRAARACLAGAGLPDGTRLRPLPPPQDGWAVFEAGAARITTFVTTVRGGATPVAFAILAAPIARAVPIARAEGRS